MARKGQLQNNVVKHERIILVNVEYSISHLGCEIAGCLPRTIDLGIYSER